MSTNRDEYFDSLLSNVDEHGWQFTFVFDNKTDNPDFGYSIGFPKTLNAPEFILFGLPRNLMHNMLWGIFRQIQNGETVHDGKRWKNLIEGFDCISRKADHSDLFTEYVLSSDWLWKENGNAGHPEVYQLVWPGSQQGLFPWEEGCSEQVIEAQTKLWRD